jgi:leucyl-tRNA synthetase
MGFPFREIEKKWRAYWDNNDINKTNADDLKNKLYCLVMFSYPSADKLHLGHWFNYSPVDTWARFKRMQGYKLFQPMGFDSFGLPAENYAVKTGVHPQDTTETSIKYIREQLKNIGAMYDWDYEVITSRPDYYKWTQWIFLELYKNKLAYRKEAPVNWCPSCQTVLANEQVKDGACERCDSLVDKKNLTQWFFNIIKYADELLEGLKKLDWPEKTKLMQQNWIGKSSGTEISFTIDNETKDAIKVFTTRPDTLFGATYMVLAPEHPLIDKITSDDKKDEVQAYIQKSVTTSEIDRVSTVREKSGVFTGCYAINPISNEKIPIWVADYVLITYGTGAIMAVPAHDERDFEFATKFNLNIRKVILAKNDTTEAEIKEAYSGEGKMMNSGEYDGMDSKPGGVKVSEYLESKNIGKRTIQFKLRDWLVSRQRYWGAPIPIIYCNKCGEVPVPEEDLPVVLPYDDVDFKPKGKSPLATSESFVNTTCPTCNAPAKREVDTMDTFVDSSWYFLRYPFNKMEDKAWDKATIGNWMPVDKYVGGAEHATMHLLYARFFTKALRDIGYLNFDEPFLSLVHQGVIKGPDGMRMSKSKGNVINPEDYLEKFGSDVFRCYLMFGFEYITGGPWDDTGIAAIDRFLNRIWRLVEENKQILSKTSDKKEFSEQDKSLNRVLNNSIKGVTQDTERYHFNTAISRIMELVNELYKYTADVDEIDYNEGLLSDSIVNLILLIAPFAPHLAEEMWRMIDKDDKTIFDVKWPEYDEKALELDEIDWVVQINGKIREHMNASKNLSKDEAEEKALKFGRIPELTQDKTVRKVIVVPQKLINIVVS